MMRLESVKYIKEFVEEIDHTVYSKSRNIVPYLLERKPFVQHAC